MNQQEHFFFFPDFSSFFSGLSEKLTSTDLKLLYKAFDSIISSNKQARAFLRFLSNLADVSE